MNPEADGAHHPENIYNSSMNTLEWTQAIQMPQGSGWNEENFKIIEQWNKQNSLY